MNDDQGIDSQKEAEEEQIEQKIINEEYKIWKKNAAFLYDMISSRALDWPTLSTQWFPDKKAVPGTNYSQHRLLYGTHTSSDSQNYILIAHIEIPDLQKPDTSQYNEGTGEIGGHGNARRPFAFNEVQKINHPGEVNKARYQPQNPNIIASLAVDGRVLIFDRTKHSSTPSPKGEYKFEMQLQGHKKEGYGLDWNTRKEGQLVTGNEDNTVKLWDIQAAPSSSWDNVAAVRTWENHAATVNDVQFHPQHESWIAAVSDDLTLHILDTRSPDDSARDKTQAHTDAVNCVAWHPNYENVLATGSADNTVALWDLRNLEQKLHSLEAHKDMVTKLEWHTNNNAVLASCSYDRRINIWDVSKIGEEQTPEEADDGPPELLFMHGGFTNRICDFSWNKNDPWLMLAAAEDNQLQIFRPARSLVNVSKKKIPHNEVSD